MTIRSLATKGRYTLTRAFACFVAIGIVNGVLGVAWPSIRATFGLPLDALVELLVSTTVGFAAGSVLAGRVVATMSLGRFLLVCNLLGGAALAGQAIAPNWWFLVFFGLITGWVNGAADTALNIYIAATRTVRIMNWMHASFGIGATVGPLLMTAIIGFNLSWRWGYAIAGLFYLMLGVLFLTVLDQLQFRRMAGGPTGGDETEGKPASASQTLRLPIVLLSILLFLLYTGVESSAGQWTYSLFTEARAVPTYMAGLMTSVFWAMLTLGRIVFGAAAARIGVERLLWLSMVGALVSAGLFMVRTLAVGFAAVSLMGLSLSAIFPTLTAETPRRVGHHHAVNTIGFQTAAASVGFAVLPGLAGMLAGRTSLESLGPFLAVSALLMLATNQVAIWLIRRERVQAEPATAGSVLD